LKFLIIIIPTDFISVLFPQCYRVSHHPMYSRFTHGITSSWFKLPTKELLPFRFSSIQGNLIAHLLNQRKCNSHFDTPIIFPIVESSSIESKYYLCSVPIVNFFIAQTIDFLLIMNVLRRKFACVFFLSFIFFLQLLDA